MNGWLIEDGSSEPSRPLYLCGVNHNGLFMWSYDHMKAIRFARKEDAEKVVVGPSVRIAEHSWTD